MGTDKQQKEGCASKVHYNINNKKDNGFKFPLYTHKVNILSEKR